MCIYAICSYVSMCSCLSKMLTHTLIYIYICIFAKKKKARSACCCCHSNCATLLFSCSSFFVFFCHMGIEKEKKYHPFLHLCLVLFHKQIQYFVQLCNFWGTIRIIRWSVQHVTPITLMYNNAAHYAANTHTVLQSRWLFLLLCPVRCMYTLMSDPYLVKHASHSHRNCLF